VRNSGNTRSAERVGRDRLRLEIKRASLPFALFLLLVVGGVLTGANILRNLAGDKPWIAYESYKVAFSDTKGVVPGRAELRLAGVKAGSIKRNDLVDGQAVLTLNLEKRHAPLYKDARVRIRPVTPLEDMYVDITSRGHPKAGKLGSDDILSGKRTISPVEVGMIVNVLDKGTRENTAALLNQLGRGLDDRGNDLRWAFGQLAPFLEVTQRMTTALAQRRESLARLVHNFGGITSEMAEHDRRLASFVKGADATLAELDSNDAPFSATLRELPPTMQSMRTSFAGLRTTEEQLDPALRSLQPVADSLPAALDALDAFSKQAEPAVRALQPSVRSLRPLARSLRPTSSSLAAAFTQLREQAPQLDRVTEKASAEKCLTITQQFLKRIMSLTKYGFGEQNFGSARANVRVDFNSAGSAVQAKGAKISQPCTRPNGAGR